MAPMNAKRLFIAAGNLADLYLDTHRFIDVDIDWRKIGARKLYRARTGLDSV